METVFCTWVRMVTRSWVHQVCLDENTQITHRLNWVDRGPVDEQRRPGAWAAGAGVSSSHTTELQFYLSELSSSLFDCIQLPTAQEQAVSLAENASTLEAGHEP